jgi:hypothetical protein
MPVVGSDNPFPSVLLVEGTTPATPASGRWRLFVDTADGLLKTVDDTGAVAAIGGSATTHIADTSSAHVASSIGFTPTGTIAATDVQAAIAEVALEAGGGTGRLIAYTVNTAGNQSITSATLADLPTNIAVTFTAPASGKVLVRLSATAGGTTTGNGFQTWGLRESTSIIAGATGESIAVREDSGGGTEQLHGVTKAFYISGLTPTTSYTYKWAAASSVSGATFKAGTNSPAIMEVIELP